MNELFQPLWVETMLTAQYLFGISLRLAGPAMNIARDIDNAPRKRDGGSFGEQFRQTTGDYGIG